MSVPTTETRSPGVRRITLDADGVPLSALLALPRYGTARATVVALHGAGMRAAYFDGRACPGQSLLGLATELGHAVLAVDRPGYGASAARLPYGQSVAEQAVTLGAALRDFAARYGTSEGLFLLAHSFGGKVALALAADAPAELLGVDVSGCGNAYAADLHEPAGPGGHWSRNWGPLRLYPPGTFSAGAAVVAPVPERELRDAARWPETWPALADRIRVPVRFTFGEHESWWRHDPPTLTRLRLQLARARRVTAEHQPGAGHNISLGWAARAYHLRALGFLEDCLHDPRPAPSLPCP
ncbi:alpha/beta hydrolase [Streptomyces sp. NBC_01352]|uniref:alpha/beta hydrolase n=1 Tax=Streptomyces TaxID=1883 RepID=UPI002258F8CB|nr:MULTISPECIES: alpha/beta hydrolase [unclassified Streptomyces]MCX4701200.1 alpha/beta hydrolase [Streptomyces sp. NBC_01373]